MPLRHLLYRCPTCGHEPVDGAGERVSCAACRTRYRRSRRGALVEVREASGETCLEEARTLVDRLRELGGPLTAPTRGDADLSYAAPALLGRSAGEDPVRHRGRLLGFCERGGPRSAGTAAVDVQALVFRSREGTEGRWPLLELGGVQVASKALQVLPRGEPLVQLEFPDDSPLRWEELLHHLLREAYRRAGRGEVVEFQPRIRAR